MILKLKSKLIVKNWVHHQWTLIVIVTYFPIRLILFEKHTLNCNVHILYSALVFRYLIFSVKYLLISLHVNIQIFFLNLLGLQYLMKTIIFVLVIFKMFFIKCVLFVICLIGTFFKKNCGYLLLGFFFPQEKQYWNRIIFMNKISGWRLENLRLKNLKSEQDERIPISTQLNKIFECLILLLHLQIAGG